MNGIEESCTVSGVLRAEAINLVANDMRLSLGLWEWMKVSHSAVKPGANECG